jgi:hypothetical protein
MGKSTQYMLLESFMARSRCLMTLPILYDVESMFHACLVILCDDFRRFKLGHLFSKNVHISNARPISSINKRKT